MNLLKKYGFVAGLFTLVIVLLVGNRLGFVFAGGAGFQPQLYFVSEGVSYPRGSTIETGADERLNISNGALALWLDEHTALHVNVLSDNHVELTLTRGRIIAIEQDPAKRIVTVIARDTKTQIINQPVSIVHYDFLGKVDVFPVDESLIKNGAAKDFYTWYYSSKD